MTLIGKSPANRRDLGPNSAKVITLRTTGIRVDGYWIWKNLVHTLGNGPHAKVVVPNEGIRSIAGAPKRKNKEWPI